MTQKQIEVYEFYKKSYPRAILFFHVKNKYIALFQDAIMIAKFMQLHPENTNIVAFPDSNLNFISNLGSGGYEIKLIDYRNSNDEMDLPDINLLSQEKNDDY